MGRGLKILCIIIKAWVATVFWVARMHLAHPDLGAHAHGVLEHPQNCGKIVGKNVNLQKVWVARVWCVTSLKVPARTHIAHMFKKSFRTHTHTCDRTSHTCVRARTFATHGLPVSTSLCSAVSSCCK